MRQEIQLFLNGQEVFFSEPPQINFVYQRTDYTNPTVIKNSYTKTLTIQGTPENNKVFNSIYNLERTQNGGDNYYNPSKRVPFELFENGDILEQGYAKLDKVTRKGYKIEYDVTLYGGLGDFFYSLSTLELNDSNEGGRDLTLADLTFRDDEGNNIDIDFDINKSAVKSAWNRLEQNSSFITNKWDIVNFAPAYNGLPKNMDADKVLIEPTGTSDITMRKIEGTSTTEINGFPTSNGDYHLYNGYALGEMKKEMTEWEMRDLRSWCQRPVMSIKGLFNGIQNSTKYNLDLDADFFNNNNPYWEEAWFTLPQLSDLDNSSEKKGSYVIMNEPVVNGLDYNYRLKASFDDSLVSGVSRVTVQFRPTIFVNGCMAEKLYPSYYPSGNWWSRVYGGLVAQLIGYDGSNNAVAGSPIIFMTSSATHNGHTNVQQLSDFDFSTPYANTVILEEGYFEFVENATTTSQTIITKSGMYPDDPAPVIEDTPLIDGWDDELFQYQSESEYKWNKDYNLTLDAGEKEIAYVVLRLTYVSSKDKYRGRLATTNTSRTSNLYDIIPNKGAVSRNLIGNMEIITPDEVCSGAHITKKKLLSSIEGTPCDYLLSYCKLFNLYFEKDLYDNTIRIRHRSNWYDGTVIDIDKDIDRTKDIEINPISFNNKFYNFKYDEEDGCEAADRYYSENGSIFGIQKVDTGYNFDSSSNDLLDGTVFKNGVQIRETSKYYKFITTNYDDELGLPPFLNRDMLTYSLFNTALENKDVYLAYPQATVSNNYSNVGDYFDNLDRLQLHGNNNEPIDGSGVLCFFNGLKATERLQGWDTEGNPIYLKIDYRLTDDVQTMIDLNGKPCWLYTNNSSHGLLINYLPHFSRYCNVMVTSDASSQIGMSWDFGSASSYLPNHRYSALSTIYSRFWKNYISDLYDVNTRIVTAYVRLRGKVLGDLLKHFYYFNNSIWVMTKITDYNITSFDTVKCEFAKVIDKEDYLKALSFSPEVILTLLDTETVPASGGTVRVNVYVSDAGSWYSEGGALQPNPDHYSGGTENTLVTITVPANETEDEIEHTFAVCADPTWANVKIKQDGIASSDIIVSKSAGTVSADGGYNSLYVVCNGNWTLTADSSYVHFSLPDSTLRLVSISGTGNTRVNAWFDANLTYNSRTVNITGTSGLKTSTVQVTQNAKAQTIIPDRPIIDETDTDSEIGGIDREPSVDEE